VRVWIVETPMASRGSSAVITHSPQSLQFAGQPHTSGRRHFRVEHAPCRPRGVTGSLASAGEGERCPKGPKLVPRAARSDLGETGTPSAASRPHSPQSPLRGRGATLTGVSEQCPRAASCCHGSTSTVRLELGSRFALPLEPVILVRCGLVPTRTKPCRPYDARTPPLPPSHFFLPATSMVRASGSALDPGGSSVASSMRRSQRGRSCLT
jgi:hypothetical protein